MSQPLNVLKLFLFVNFSPFTLLKFASIKKASQSSSEEYIGLVSY